MPHGRIPTGTLVFVIFIAWFALSAGEPRGKDFILVVFTTVLVILAALRGRQSPQRGK